MSTKRTEYLAFEDKETPAGFPLMWRVEALNTDSGGVYIAIFDGPDAQVRAVEYALFKNGKAVLPSGKGFLPAPEKAPTKISVMTKNNGEMTLYLDSLVWVYDAKRRHITGRARSPIEPTLDNPTSLGAD